MARSVYFSFHYQDVFDFRANVLRNSGKFRKSGDVFRDSSIWEEAKEKQILKIKSLIDAELKGSSITCVLIDSETYSSRWVRYEIFKSFQMKKGQVGVGINWTKDKHGKILFWKGENPFNYLSLKVVADGKFIDLLEYKETIGLLIITYLELKIHTSKKMILEKNSLYLNSINVIAMNGKMARIIFKTGLKKQLLILTDNSIIKTKTQQRCI
jgi:hypothetical protein